MFFYCIVSQRVLASYDFVLDNMMEGDVWGRDAKGCFI